METREKEWVQKKKYFAQKELKLTVGCHYCNKLGDAKDNSRRKINQCIIFGSSKHFAGNYFQNQCKGTGSSGQSRVIQPEIQTSEAKRAGKPQVKSKNFALEDGEVNEDAKVAESMLNVFNYKVKFLIDLGSTHSFVTPQFSNTANMMPQELSLELLISAPLGTSVVADKVL